MTVTENAFGTNHAILTRPTYALKNMAFFKKLKEAILGHSAKHEQSEHPQRELSQTELEEILIEADFGVGLATKIAKEIGSRGCIATKLKAKLVSILSEHTASITIDKAKKPFVITLVGVNGSGKTTTVAKLAHLLKSQGYSIAIAACDTFRAAAQEQLATWAARLDCAIFKADTPRDPASVAFEAMQTTADVLLVDTAGRLQNNANLMGELAKIYRVLGKADATAPHTNIIVIDATTGQNALEQAREFDRIWPLTGVIMAKTDGNAKGGMIVRIVDELQIPIFGVGTGERATDFEGFSVDKFLQELIG